MTDTTRRGFPDLWVDPEDDPRRQWSRPAGELETHWHYLRAYRATIELKCDGLDADQLARRSVPPSTLSLLGLVRHLARVEHHWFRRVLQGQAQLDGLYQTPQDPDADFTGAVADPQLPVRDVLEHLVEEYVRHAGHADLLRECIDGCTGQ